MRTQLFNIQMLKALPAQKLQTTWQQVINSIGELKEVVKTMVTEESGYRTVYVTCKFEKTSLEIKVVFDSESKISGLWFVPTKSEGIYIAATIATGASIMLGGTRLPAY
ncbi:MAG: DUF3887 domain-containing protein [Nitrososphaeria archaeon]